MKKVFVAVLACLLVFSSKGQSFRSPYKFSTQVDVPISFSAISVLAASYAWGKSKKLPSEENLLALDRMNINKFDRSATNHYSKKIALSSDALMFAAMALPLAHLANSNSRKDFGKVAAMGAEVFLLNIAATNFIKEAVGRTRPYVYNPNVPMAKKRKLDNFKSFFSGHTSTTAAMSFFFAKTYADYNSNSKLKPMVWSLSALLPAVTGFLRYRAGKHFWSDIIVGYAVGTLIGVGVPALHNANLGINR